MKTGNDFKEQVKKHNIGWWTVRHCSFCNHPIGYNFRPFGSVVFDGGCNCANISNKQVRSWDDVAEIYNIQTNTEVIAEMDKFWHFD